MALKKVPSDTSRAEKDNCVGNPHSFPDKLVWGVSTTDG